MTLVVWTLTVVCIGLLSALVGLTTRVALANRRANRAEAELEWTRRELAYAEATLQAMTSMGLPGITDTAITALDRIEQSRQRQKEIN